MYLFYLLFENPTHTSNATWMISPPHSSSPFQIPHTEAPSQLHVVDYKICISKGFLLIGFYSNV